MPIEIPHWFGDDDHPGFQHYRDRDPIWIKNYTRLLSDDAYRSLTAPQRAVLHGIWLEYARSGRKLSENTASLSRKLGVRVTKTTLEALNHAGFITLSASSTLAPRYQAASAEKRREEKEKNKGLTYQDPNGTDSDADIDLTPIAGSIQEALRAAERKGP